MALIVRRSSHIHTVTNLIVSFQLITYLIHEDKRCCIFSLGICRYFGRVIRNQFVLNSIKWRSAHLATDLSLSQYNRLVLSGWCALTVS